MHSSLLSGKVGFKLQTTNKKTYIKGTLHQFYTWRPVYFFISRLYFYKKTNLDDVVRGILKWTTSFYFHETAVNAFNQP